MRITLSQLRKIIREAVTLEKTPMKLRILDFDDTLAHTGEEVRLYTPQGHRMLSSDEYAVYQPAEGEYYDETSFDQFDRVDVTRAQPVSAVFKVLVNFVNAQEGNRKILILTARKQVVEPDVRSQLLWPLNCDSGFFSEVQTSLVTILPFIYLSNIERPQSVSTLALKLNPSPYIVTSANDFASTKCLLCPESLQLSPHFPPVDLNHPSTGIFSAKIGEANKLNAIRFKVILFI